MAKAPLTFGRFVETPENRAGLLAVRRLADKFASAPGRPGDADADLLPPPFPTLFLHGPAGCGKSHLVSALATDIVNRRRDAIIHVLTAGELARSEQQSLFASEGDQGSFAVPSELQDARHGDVLIVEDLQHLNLRMAESLVNTLDYLVARCRPVVFTANAGPRGLTHRGERFPARLSSRLSAGLVVALEPLGPVSRLALLQSLAQRQQLAVSTEILGWLAERLTAGGRQIEGAITQLASLVKLSKGNLDFAAVQKHFEPQTEKCKPTVERIAQRVGSYFRVDTDDLQSSRRQREIVLSRHVGMYLARELTGLTLEQIGDYFGGRDHSTVLHACRKVERAIARDQMMNGVVRELQAGLA